MSDKAVTQPAVRFAPSPTGLLHIGNIRTATLNWLFARKHGGNVLLRLDDTDVERSRDEFADAIRRDLSWLGLDWDREESQKGRTDRYDLAAERLKAAGLLYPCFETSEELERKRRRQLANHRPPIYDRSALKLGAEEISERMTSGAQPHWRFRLPNTDDDERAPKPTPVSWDDLVRGELTVDLGSLSDPVLIRADGTYLYTFTSIVDDAELGISHIIRGDDHVTNTGVQIAIFNAFGFDAPAFGHHSLLVGAEGQALSKRLGALSIESLRDSGYEPMAVLSHAALIGTSEAIEPCSETGALIDLFGLEKISTAPGRFDLAELRNLNAKLLHNLSFDQVRDRLTKYGVSDDAEDFWLAVRGNLEVLSDVELWWRVTNGAIEPQIEDAAFLKAAADLLPEEPWNEATWGAWTAEIKKETGRKGRALFHPLRLALTGEESGPELKALLPLIGRERVLKRFTSSQ